MSAISINAGWTLVFQNVESFLIVAVYHSESRPLLATARADRDTKKSLMSLTAGFGCESLAAS
jgi:hypothetical protein